jgi:hypothetical protein
VLTVINSHRITVGVFIDSDVMFGSGVPCPEGRLVWLVVTIVIKPSITFIVDLSHPLIDIR